MGNGDRNMIGWLGKYVILAFVSYFVTLTVTQHRLDHNQVLLISVAIAIVFGIIDLYSGLFSGIMTAMCNCPPGT